jgi:DNA-binding MarR family transcriptional regulator
MDNKSLLQLEEQLCFPIYATSRMVTRSYQPYLDKINLTYPQYIVMLVLWENDELSIKEICDKLYLHTNTLTPLINKLKDKALLTKYRSAQDERSVIIKLTSEGKALKKEAEKIPLQLMEAINFPEKDLIQMRSLMWKFLKGFENN